MNENFNKNLPCWNLNELYPSLSCDEYKSDILLLKNSIQELKKLLNDFKSDDFENFLKKALALLNKISSLSKTLNAYAYIIYSTDTNSYEKLGNLELVKNLLLGEEEQTLRFQKILGTNQNLTDEFLEKNPEYSDFKFFLKNCIQESFHKMSDEEEKLAGELSQTGSEAWSLLQEQIISNLHDEKSNTFNSLRAMASSKDALVRKNAYLKEIELLRQNEIALAASLNNLKGQTVILNKKRKWTSALEKSLFTSRISKKSINALFDAIKESLPMWRKYFMAKALILRKLNQTKSETAGTKGEKGIAFYDLFAPIIFDDKNQNKTQESPVSKIWTFDEAENYVTQKFYAFSKDMGDFAKNAYEKNWVDFPVKKGKVGGAYDEDFPKGHQSRILVNFTGSFSDIITLAHETGHAYHFSCLKGLPSIFYDYPMTLAESASTFAETIVKQDMKKNTFGKDRILLLDFDLQDVSQVFVDIYSRFYFENSVFEQREKSSLSAQDFCNLMKEAQSESYGDGLNSERHEYMWAVKSHYYIPDFDFYNYPYAFGQLFASSLYQKNLAEGKEFANEYKKILSKTGNFSCEDLCAECGFDICKKEFYLEAMKIYFDEIEEFSDFAQKL